MNEETQMNDRNYPNDAESILAAAKALVPVIVESREEIECERRLPLRLVDALKQAGVPLGVARAALETLIADGEKPSRLTTLGRPGAVARTLREEEFVQDAIGR